jgi:hypothetical protein
VASKNENRLFDSKAMQIHDLPPEGQKAVAGAFSEAHSNVATRSQQFKSAKSQTNEAVDAVRPHLKDKKVTIQTAANARGRMLSAAATDNETRLPGENLPGSGWYFKHHGDLAAAASEHGYDTNKAITASATMSPQNSPENEKAAVTGLMKTHTSGKVFVSPEVHAHLTHQGISVDDRHKDATVAVRDLHPDAVAALSDPKIRSAITGDNFDAKEIARGGSRQAISKATSVLRGDIPEHEALNPTSAPKVSSYRDSIRDAVPDTDVHNEYMARAAHIGDLERGDAMKGQQMLDLYGKRHSTEGLLDPKHATAEDTWMNSISTGQKNQMVDGGRQNVMKVAGSHLSYTAKKKFDGVSATPDPRISGNAVLHAANNGATIKAGADLAKKHGLDYHVPSVMMQEVPWTEARRAGGKDPAFNKATAAQSKSRQFDEVHPDQGQLF